MESKRIIQITLRMFLLSGILLCIPAHTQAQGSGSVDKIAQAMTDSLSYLKLTDPQKGQVLELNKTASASLAQLAQKAKQDTTFRGKALAQKVMGVMKERNTSLKKILTPDQQKLFGEHQLQQLAELQTKMMTAQLGLTDAQIPQVYQVNLKETGEMMKDLEKVKSTKRKLKKAREAKSLKSDASDKDKALKGILTSEQYEKYEKNKAAQQAAMKQKMQEKKAK